MIKNNNQIENNSIFKKIILKEIIILRKNSINIILKKILKIQY